MASTVELYMDLSWLRNECAEDFPHAGSCVYIHIPTTDRISHDTMVVMHFDYCEDRLAPSGLQRSSKARTS